MDELFLKVDYLPSWLRKYFERFDIITLEQIIDLLEDLDSEVKELRIEKEERGN